jgi:tyrosine-protein kinase Etk/Wzc
MQFNNIIDHENSIKEKLRIYTNRWVYFVISVFLFLTFAFLKLRFTTKTYEANATILIKDDNKTNDNAESVFQNFGLTSGNSKKDNEIEILKSRKLMEKIVDDLDLNIQYLVKGGHGPLFTEEYKFRPIHINFEKENNSRDTIGGSFKIIITSPTQFDYSDLEETFVKHYKFGKLINTEFGKITITPGELSLNNLLNKEIKVVIGTINNTATSYLSRLEVEVVNKESDVLKLSFTDESKLKAKDILNNLIYQHKLDAIEDKNQSSQNTADFINERMKLINKELMSVEEDVEKYKSKHKITDFQSDAGKFATNSSSIDKDIIETNTQLYVTMYMIDYLKQYNSNSDILPTNLGVTDASISHEISNYNNLVLERNRLAKNSSDKNPIVLSLNEQINNINRSLKNSLQNLKNTLQIKLKQQKINQQKINQQISLVPKYEREFRDLQRQQQIKETLYLYLLQKREETELSLAITVANVKIIDEAYCNDEPIAPNSKLFYIIAFFFGVIIPIVFIYIRTLFDVKIHSKLDIERAGLPYIGDIPLSDTAEKLVVRKEVRTSVAEAFRLLRTNINFLIPYSSQDNKGKTIFITSTISNEGKSFIALNLAATLGLSGKKVLLTGMDLRAPKILEYLKFSNTIGFTSYIVDHSITVNDIKILNTGITNVDVVPSGPIPPNPSELLMSGRVKEFFDIVQNEYDYIVIDTAPVGMVTDTLLLSNYSDIFIYVSRAKYLDKKLLSLPTNLIKDKKLKNLHVLLNCSEYNKDHNYGYGYGYGYGEGFTFDKHNIPWYKKIF